MTILEIIHLLSQEVTTEDMDSLLEGWGVDEEIRESAKTIAVRVQTEKMWCTPAHQIVRRH